MPTQSDYFEAHESQYAKRLHEGHVAWDAGPYEDYFMRPFVMRSLERATFAVADQNTGRRALELGCGTGALSCDLARAGFDVLALDISPSAIAFANSAAAERGLKIAFEVADVCRRSLYAQHFDLVVDGHLLHCIVFEQERFELLTKVRQSLRTGGELWIETMMQSPGHPLNPEWNLDDRGVLWARVQDGSGYRQAAHRADGWWLPQRLIAHSEASLVAELSRAGLRIIESETYSPLEPHAPGGYRARCVATE